MIGRSRVENSSRPRKMNNRITCERLVPSASAASAMDWARVTGSRKVMACWSVGSGVVLFELIECRFGDTRTSFSIALLILVKLVSDTFYLGRALTREKTSHA